MALNKTGLEAAIKAAFDSESDVEVNPPQARDRQAKKIADAIDAFVRSGTVNVNVITSGSSTNHTGTGTGQVN